ncbi:hypothetical protein J437_LFUL016929 [Ladona fulva]|uniref:Uncharacterized protein n=1 Tax=Ladona fulva TaxID=123851 RepID=A0A8K0KNR4_LADFU|nr:hypothetical protein J437_LFUL016929 [Ladona fulva]
MQAILALLAVIGVASAGILAPVTTLVRTPSLDSAVIKSDRIGGNFAYSTASGHAYAAYAPVISHVTTPVAVSYSAHAPVVTSYAAPYASHFGYPYSYSYGAWTPSYGSVVVA